MQKINKLIATLFYLGYLPIAPGTISSLIGVGFYLIIKDNLLLHLISFFILLFAGLWSSSRMEEYFGSKDPSQIVIDEFTAILLVYIFIPFNIKLLVVGFVLFRIFDIFKIPPIKQIQQLPKGWGIMVDDISCAIFTNIILHVLRFFGIFF